MTEPASNQRFVTVCTKIGTVIKSKREAFWFLSAEVFFE